MKFNLMNVVPKSVTLAAGKTVMKVRKYSPEILMVTGIGSLIGAGIYACTATLKVESVLDNHTLKIDKCNEVLEHHPDDQYNQTDHTKDIQLIKVQTAFEFVKLYGPSVTMAGAGVVCILSGYNIMKKRNVALVAAYKLIEESFANYRKRVVDELGVDKDQQFYYGTEYIETTEQVVDPETGKKKKVKTTEQVLNGQPCSGYARLFCDPEDSETDDVTSQWSPKDNGHGDFNMMFLRQKMNWMNEKLRAYGHVFLNDVYEELGFPPTQAGQIVGWVKGNGDGYISFGNMVEALTDREGRAFTHDQIKYRKGDPILLDFNVDGVIWDLI